MKYIRATNCLQKCTLSILLLNSQYNQASGTMWINADRSSSCKANSHEWIDQYLYSHLAKWHFHLAFAFFRFFCGKIYPENEADVKESLNEGLDTDFSAHANFKQRSMQTPDTMWHILVKAEFHLERFGHL